MISITIDLNYPNLHHREPMPLARNTGRRFVDVSAKVGFRGEWRWATWITMADSTRL
jgi:hypothetical protein